MLFAQVRPLQVFIVTSRVFNPSSALFFVLHRKGEECEVRVHVVVRTIFVRAVFELGLSAVHCVEANGNFPGFETTLQFQITSPTNVNRPKLSID